MISDAACWLQELVKQLQLKALNFVAQLPHLLRVKQIRFQGTDFFSELGYFALDKWLNNQLLCGCAR